MFKKISRRLASDPSETRAQLLLLACILASAFNLRTAVTSLTPLLESLRTIFDFSNTAMGIFGMLPALAFALSAAYTRRIIFALNLERTAILSMFLATLGLIIRSLSPSTEILFVSSFIALVGMGIGNAVLPPLVKRYFFHHIGAVSTFYITILQLGTLLPAFVAVPIASASDWRLSLGVWIIPAFTATAIWFYTWFRLPFLKKQPSLRPDPTQPHVTGQVWKTKIAWGMAFMFGMTSLNTYSMFTWLPSIFTSAGASKEFGGAMLGLFAALGIVSSILAPLLAVRMRNIFPLILGCGLCFVIAYAGLYWNPLQYTILWVTLLGLAPSTFPLALTLINLRSRTPEGSAALSGFMQGLGYMISTIGPLLFGIFHDYTSTWGTSFFFLSACVCILMVGGWIASQRQMVEDQW